MVHHVRKEYAALAWSYERRWRRYLSVTHEKTLNALGETPASTRLLDVGCGTGRMLATLHARRPDLTLIGLDASEAMLEQAPAATAGIDWVHGNLNALPLSDASVHTIISCSALHYLDDPQQALHEMRRILVHDGVLVLTDWRTEHLLTALRCLRLRWLRRPLGHVLSTAEALSLLRRARFQPQSVERYSVAGWGLFTVRASAA